MKYVQKIKLKEIENGNMNQNLVTEILNPPLDLKIKRTNIYIKHWHEAF